MLREFLNVFKTSSQTILFALSKRPPLSRLLPLAVCLSPTLTHRSDTPICGMQRAAPLSQRAKVTALALAISPKHHLKFSQHVFLSAKRKHLSLHVFAMVQFQHEFCYLMK